VILRSGDLKALASAIEPSTPSIVRFDDRPMLVLEIARWPDHPIARWQ
jgi:hypothetical protein